MRLTRFMVSRYQPSLALAAAALAWIALGPCPEASAAVWSWGCIGQLGDKTIVLYRFWLAELPAKSWQPTWKQLAHPELEPKLSDDGESALYNADDGNSGLEKTMTFTRDDKSGRTVTLTERSSRTLSNKTGRAGPRDEITVMFKKVYRYAASDEPERTVTMQCIDYTLTTTGGRQR